ncbi:hypothetical protein ACFQZK_12965 [Rhodococcus aetherivorans]
MSSPGVALGVLGGFAATVDGRPIDLGGIRQRALLAALVVAFPGDVSGSGCSNRSGTTSTTRRRARCTSPSPSCATGSARSDRAGTRG